MVLHRSRLARPRIVRWWWLLRLLTMALVTLPGRRPSLTCIDDDAPSAFHGSPEHLVLDPKVDDVAP